jgi:predicted nucleotidyltransferase
MSNRLDETRVLRSLSELAEAFAPDPVVVLGASALQFHRPQQARSTLDVDVAVGAEAHVPRMPAGWTQSGVPHRWVVDDGLPIDIVPATAEDLRRGHVDWPGGRRMSLLGVDLAVRDAVRHSMSAPANLLVASLLGLFVCKVVAYGERPGDRIKDLGDLALVLETYVEPDDPRFYDDEALETDAGAEVSFEDRPAYLLGRDLRLWGEDSHRQVVERFVVDVLREGSRERALFLREAGRVGTWTEELLHSRSNALRVGMSAGC